MKKPLRLALLAIVGTVGLFAVQAAQQPGAATHSDDFTDLKLSLTTLKDGFLQLEPVPIIISISNPTDNPVIGHTAISFSSNFVELYVSRGGEEPRKIIPLSPVIDQTLVRSREIMPGEEVSVAQLLTMNLSKVFPEPGVYHIEAQLYDASHRQFIRSNKLQIKILQPKAEDAKAFDIIRGGEAKYSFFSGSGFADQDYIQQLERLATEFKDTAYADYAEYLLGGYYAVKGDDQRALTHLSKLEKKSGFVYKDEVNDRLGHIRRKLSQ